MLDSFVFYGYFNLSVNIHGPWTRVTAGYTKYNITSLGWSMSQLKTVKKDESLQQQGRLCIRFPVISYNLYDINLAVIINAFPLQEHFGFMTAS